MINGFYEELNELQKDYPESDFGFLENTDVTSESNAHNFLHGCCDEFAAMLSEMYGYEIECVRNAEGRLVHAYCITEIGGEKAYIDVRGTTTNPVLFFEEFENEITYYPEDGTIMTLNDDSYEVEAKTETWKDKDSFFDGEYEGWSDEDIKQFIREQGIYYNPNRIREGVFAKQMFFHVTPLENVESIRKKGLVPQIGERSAEIGETEENVYLFTSYEAMDNALMNWLGEWYNERYGEDCELAVLKILVPPEIEVVDEGVSYEVVCKERIPSEYISFYDELGNELSLKEELTLYRYEIYCEGKDQDVGFLVGIEDLGLSCEKEFLLLKPFDDALANPILPGMRNSVSFFTEAGNKKFQKAIRDVVVAYEDSIFDVKLAVLRLPSSVFAQVVYQDENQVCLPREFYKKELEDFITRDVPVWDDNFKVVDSQEIGPLYHVGTMDISKKATYSLEGNGLSVSNCPEVWRKITKGSTHGDSFLLYKENVKLLDYYALAEDEKGKIISWAIEEGYVVSETLYKYMFDDEDGNVCYSLFSTYEEALYEADDDMDWVEAVDGLLPTDKMKEESIVKVELLNVMDFITSYYAEKVLGYDGVYWDETLDVAAYSAPRGVIFNSKLDAFHVKNVTKERQKPLDEKIKNAAIGNTVGSVRCKGNDFTR